MKDVLFPYAYSHLPEFLESYQANPLVAGQLDSVSEQTGIARDDLAALTQQLLDWIDEDVKATPLKTLQGVLWERGYVESVYQAHLYEDAADMLCQWKSAGLDLYVYSSGSVAAQKLFFRFSEAGDLSGLFSGYFDTNIGHKASDQSYRNIASQIGYPTAEILFLSDVVAELDAARLAEMKTTLLRRIDESDSTDEGDSSHPRVRDFRQIDLDSIS